MYSFDEKLSLIKAEIIKASETNPVVIAKRIMHMDFVNMHGPEHHFLDGASFLIAYKNAGGELDIESALDALMERATKMPGAMCGKWGVCGASASLGASLAIIHGTGPLSDNEYYSDNMDLTSTIIKEMSYIGGPRCCKRNAFLSLKAAVDFVNQHYGIKMEIDDIECEFSNLNAQCLKDRCPFHK